ncbi:MAG: LysE family translocator [Pelagibacteraceae bacterium]|jgi:threonine/homoserine/homoserine lactone efflux protein|nr:LysE family translocator [Pelagibacteraceae bacterium]MBT5213753.1 LysE family translocator [Pelagibacteraceae bacterium]MBT6354458.1 LysE family translocator [Pelagibacteraceae bacterium]
MVNWFWLQFAAICIVGAMSPGPSMALIIRNSIKFGRVSGLLSSIGHAIGIGIYAAISIAGLQLILISNIIIFNTIQFCGSIFLLILGILFLKKSGERFSIEDDQKSLNSFFQGFAISILNPKILIWFAAIFSQFIEVSSTGLTKFMMVFIASSIDGIWYIILTIIVTSFGLKKLIESNTKTIQNISGLVLILISLIILYKTLRPYLF